MKINSVICAVNLAQALSIDELPIDNRSDEWWDEFWHCFGLQEAVRIRRRNDNIKKFAGRK